MLEERLLPLPIRVAIYVRVSTEEQAEHGFSIDAQIETLTNHCKLYGKTIYKIFSERGVSGKSIEPPYPRIFSKLSSIRSISIE